MSTFSDLCHHFAVFRLLICNDSQHSPSGECCKILPMHDLTTARPARKGDAKVHDLVSGGRCKPHLPRAHHLAKWAFSSFCLLILAGCEKPEPIVTYTIPTKVPAQLIAGKDRMLAVMLPKDSDVWYFKVTGPEAAITEVEAPFRKFVADVSFAQDGPDLNELPDGWHKAGNKQFRFASINIDTPSKQLDLSVSKLPRRENWDEQVTMDVNRWRGQLGLEPSQEKWAGGQAIELSSADSTGIWVDLIGQSSGASMSPPFAGGGAGGGPFSSGQLPPDHPPVTTSDEPTPPGSRPQASPPKADSRLKFDRPEGWREGKMSSMRMAAFNVGPEDAAAEITVIPAGGDLKGNVKRWMGQIRQDEVTDEQVDQAMGDAAEVDVSGMKGHRYILVGDEQTIDATIVPLEAGMSLFIKMTGPAKTVADQADEIDTFLKSMKLNL